MGFVPKKFQSVTCSGGSSQSIANFSMVIDTVREKRDQVCCFLFTRDQRTINKFDARLMLVHRQVDTFIIVQLKVVVLRFFLNCVQKLVNGMSVGPKN